MDSTPLSALRKLADYREKRAHIFPSDHALQWFVRRRRAELVNAGALVMLTGQWYAHEDKFDAVVLEVGQQVARGHAQGAR